MKVTKTTLLAILGVVGVVLLITAGGCRDTGGIGLICDSKWAFVGLIGIVTSVWGLNLVNR